MVNPFAERLTFLDEQTRTRRDHRKYLALIRTIALLHQHQRAVRQLARPGAEPVAYIEATRRRHRRRQPPGPRGAGDARWTSCRRRRGAC